MAAARRIIFRDIALFDSSIYTAMMADQVESFDHDSQFGVVETFDTKGSDYPRLREALRNVRFSFAVYQQRENDGDHTSWMYSFAGDDEHYNTNADHPAPIQFIRDVTR